MSALDLDPAARRARAELRAGSYRAASIEALLNYVDRCERLRPPVDPRLIADVEQLHQHHAFTRDRIGEPGCRVRLEAADRVKTIERVLIELRRGEVAPPAQSGAALFEERGPIAGVGRQSIPRSHRGEGFNHVD